MDAAAGFPMSRLLWVAGREAPGAGLQLGGSTKHGTGAGAGGSVEVAGQCMGVTDSGGGV